MTPVKLVFGREIRLPGDLMFGSPETQSQEPQNYSSQLENRLREMNRLVRGRLKIASDKMETRYDIRSNSVGSVSYTHLDVYKRQVYITLLFLFLCINV